MVLKRARTLIASNDSRLQLLPKFSVDRIRGTVGEPVEVPFGKDDDKKFFILFGEDGYSRGLYRSDELEDVTPEQLALEMNMAALLAIFPNKYQFLALNPETCDSVDVFTAVEIVPELRKQYKLELEWANSAALAEAFAEISE